MARAGLTWTLKLNDAMSGAAKKIAASLDKVQGELEALDKAKVDGPAESVKKLQDRLESQQQKRSERESDRAQKSSKRIAEQIGSVEEKAAERSATVRERLESKAVKARARVNNQAAGQISRGETNLAEMRARYDSMVKKDGKRGVKLKEKIAAQEQIVGELRQKTKERAESEYRRFTDEASKYEEKQSKAAARTRARLEKQEAQRAERFAERSAKQAQKSQDRIAKLTTAEAERSEKQIARKREQLTKRREKLEQRLQRAQARKTTKRAGAGDGMLGAGMLGAVTTGAMLAADAIAALANAVVALGQRVIELQSFKQATQFAFRQILGSSAAADDAWGRAQKIAESTGISIQEIAGSMNALLAQGMGIGEVEELTKRFADLKALNPAANIDGIARALMQIKATGKLQGDELMQLNEAGLASDKVYAQLEKRLGKTRDEILKMQAAGKISSQDAIEAIKAALRETTGKEAGAVAAEMAEKTLGGAIGRLKVQFEKLLMMDSPAFEKVAKLVNKISDGLASGKAQPILDAIFESINKITDALLAIPADSMAQKIQAVAFAIGAVGSAIAFTITALDKIQAVAITVWTGISAAVQTTVDAINNVSASVGAVIDKVLNLGSTFEEGGRKMGTSLVQGIIAAIAGGGGAIASAVSAVVTEAVKAAVENIGDVDLSLGGSFGASPAGDAMMMGAMAGREVRSTTTNKQFAPTVNVNISGGASNTGGIVGAISDTLKSLNNSFA